MYICVWVNKKLNRIRIDNIALDEKVSNFKKFAVTTLDNKLQNYEFIFRGCVLKDDKYLSDYNLDENSEIQAIERISIKPFVQYPPGNTEEEIQNIVSSFRVLTQNPGFRSNAQRVVRSGALSDIQKCVPNLANDSVAFSILMDPELLTHLADPDTVRLLGEKHPSLVRAADLLAKILHDQSNSIHQQPTTSTGYSYSLDALSDDEDMDSTPELSRDLLPITRNSSFNAITSAQLAAAIANATNTAFNSSVGGVQSSSGTTSNVITSEMFSNALQQAFDNTPTGTPPVTPGENEGNSFSPLSQRYESEMRQMQEMGLLNTRINLRALQTASGNLQEAVELILNGVID